MALSVNSSLGTLPFVTSPKIVSRKTQTQRKPAAWKTFVQNPIFPYLLLFVITVVAYLPALRGGFIWDDDDYVTRNSTLRDLHGLYRIWFEVGAVPQYYPLVHTTFWLENHLWGLDPFYFHLGNVLLHALAAILLWRSLRWLRVPGCWLAAAIFALHPVG